MQGERSCRCAPAEDGSAVVPLLGGLAGATGWRGNRRGAGRGAGDHQRRAALRHLRAQPARRLCPADWSRASASAADLLGGARRGAAGWLDAPVCRATRAAALAIHVTPSACAAGRGTADPSALRALAALEPAVTRRRTRCGRWPMAAAALAACWLTARGWPIRACRLPPMRFGVSQAFCRRLILLRACARPCLPPSRSATGFSGQTSFSDGSHRHVALTTADNGLPPS